MQFLKRLCTVPLNSTWREEAVKALRFKVPPPPLNQIRPFPVNMRKWPW